MTTSQARLNANTGGPALALLPGPGQERRHASRPSTVLVHVRASRDGEALVRQAADVANLFGAKLIGVSTPPIHAPARMSSVEEDATELVLENAGRCFETWTSSVRAGACWTAADGPPAAALARLAWAADLIMVGDGSVASLKSLIVRGGRPVLLRPEQATSATFERILVRWDGSAACRRAISSALPFLARADRVDIAPVRDEAAPSVRRALRDLEEGLALRGIEVRTTAGRRLGWAPGGGQVFAGASVDLVVTSVWSPQPRWPLFARSVDRRLQEIKSWALLSP